MENRVSDIPIVGKPAKVLMWYPTAIIQCLCAEGELTLLIVTGIGNTVVCGKCSKLYTAIGILPDQKLDIRVTTPTPTGLVN